MTELRHGTRQCWEAGCDRYECLIAAKIDPVVVQRRVDANDTRLRGLTANERVEYQRRIARKRRRAGRVWTPIGRLSR